MLHIDNDSESVIAACDLIPSRIKLPDEWSDFFSRSGPLNTKFDDERRYRRSFVRGKAIIRHNDELHTVYTKDISRMGLGLIHSEQLLPCEQIQIWLPSRLSYWLRVVRCVRIKELCYECGTTFLYQKS